MLSTRRTSTSRPMIRLNAGESVLREGQSRRKILPAWSVPHGLVVGTSIGLLSAMAGVGTSLTWIELTAATLTLSALLVGVAWGLNGMRWSWHRWWLTDQRLVVRTGFIGYQLRSVPLDRIVDVTLQASWWDRLWGLQHVQIRDMNSEVSSGTSRPGLRLIAVPEAEAVTDAILNACPALGSETDRMDEVVVLLGALVDKAS